MPTATRVCRASADVVFACHADNSGTSSRAMTTSSPRSTSAKIAGNRVLASCTFTIRRTYPIDFVSRVVNVGQVCLPVALPNWWPWRWLYTTACGSAPTASRATSPTSPTPPVARTSVSATGCSRSRRTPGWQSDLAARTPKRRGNEWRVRQLRRDLDVLAVQTQSCRFGATRYRSHFTDLRKRWIGSGRRRESAAGPPAEGLRAEPAPCDERRHAQEQQVSQRDAPFLAHDPYRDRARHQ